MVAIPNGTEINGHSAVVNGTGTGTDTGTAREEEGGKGGGSAGKGAGTGTNEPISHLINSDTTSPKQREKDDLTLVIQSFRLLIADLCQQFGMGHPG